MQILRNIAFWLYSPFKTDQKGDIKAVFYCLLAAVVFWFFNAMNRDHTANISYPIKFVYNDSSLVLVSPLPKKISMQVQGYGWNLLRKTFWFNIEPIVYKLNKPLETKVISSRSLMPYVTEQLGGIKVNSLLKDTIWINFERKVIKEQLLFVDTSKVSVAEGLRIVLPIILDPQRVLIEGPESIVNKLSDTLFLSIPQNRIEDDFDSEVKIFEVSNLIRLDQKKVHVIFKVEPLPPPAAVPERDSTASDSAKKIGIDNRNKKE